jgi:16S rRNA (cytosine1402-N4)-methyltransferase
VSDDSPAPHRRRPRYRGTHPRRFDEKYKELAPEKYPETFAKVLASGKTPAGAHVSILVPEVLEALDPRPGDVAVDCTLGYGGHASALLPRLLPSGVLLGLDVDPIELPKTESRLRMLGFGADAFRARRSNFAGLLKALAAEGLPATDCLLADLGVSSMQLDTPSRGFSITTPGPLDMRMNPDRGQPASVWLRRTSAREFATLLADVDEPRAEALAAALAGAAFDETTALAGAVRLVGRAPEDEREASVRRVFLALRVVVNDEFGALDTLLRQLPNALAPGGRAAILTFHSGEDRRVKRAFQAGAREGVYGAVSDEVIRPGRTECRANPRATAAKLRWAVRAVDL